MDLSRFIEYLKYAVSWKWVFLIGMLTLSDMLVHPLGNGPDRLIHDPAVYRMSDSTYMQGDWYTDMATDSGVYTYYGKLVNAWHILAIPQELWRTVLYISSLIVLYYALVSIARVFSSGILVIPVVALFHAFLLANGRSPWLYGPFMQIDGGLAPRSIGMSLSFLALLFLIRGKFLLPSVLLGLATLFHVSNSLIVFSLFFIVWCLKSWFTSKVFPVKATVLGTLLYILTGGWFAFYLAALTRSEPHLFSADKFIWTWVYVRASYLALPYISSIWWVLLGLHVAAIIGGWWLLRRRVKNSTLDSLDYLALVGIGSILYFGFFYIVGFIWPWLPGFQFYSIRVVYFAYFVAYLFIALLIPYVWHSFRKYQLLAVFLGSLVVIWLFLSSGSAFFHEGVRNAWLSWNHVADSSLDMPREATGEYLVAHPEPFLAPIYWQYSSVYLPSVITFKSFGFTSRGLPEWFDRLNSLSKGELENRYQEQLKAGIFAPTALDWDQIYSNLTTADVLSLSEKYHFRLFLTLKKNLYPFSVVVEDAQYRLYQISN